MASETEAGSSLTDLPKAHGRFDKILVENLSTNFSKGSSQSSATDGINNSNLSELSRESSLEGSVPATYPRKYSVEPDPFIRVPQRSSKDNSTDLVSAMESTNSQKAFSLAMDPKSKSISKAKMRKSISVRRQSAATRNVLNNGGGTEMGGFSQIEDGGGIFDYYYILNVEREDPVKKLWELP